MNRKIAGIRSGRGFSLVEIMVALVLGMLIMTALLTLFLGNQRTYRLSDAVARLQENGRFALEALVRDIRMAGHLGCADPRLIVANDQDLLDSPYPSESAIVGSDGATDAITIRYADGDFGELASDVDSVDAVLELTDEPAADAFAEGTLAVLADCSSATVLEAAGVSGKKVSHHGIDKTYTEGTRLMRLVENTYDIRDTGRRNSAGDPIFSLYRNGQEIVEGVENLQIRYGQMVNGTLRYVDWSPSLRFDDLVSIRLAVLLHSLDPVAENPDETTYDLAGVTVAPAPGTAPTHPVDRRLRRVFSTTIELRNGNSWLTN